MIFDEYSKFYNKHLKDFNNEKIVLLLQVGSFYEIYDDGNKISYMEELGSILNMVVTKKDKSILKVSKNNCLLIGFPCYALNKYTQKLLDNNYKIIVYNQYTDETCKTSKKIIRKLHKIYTKSVNDNIDINNYTKSNWLMGIEYDISSISVSLIDIMTGESNIHFSYTCDTFIEFSRYLIEVYSPSEIIIFNNSDLNLNLEYNNILYKPYTHYNIKESNEILSKIFTNTKLLSPIEYLNLEKFPECLNNFVNTIKYAYSCNDELVKFLQIPQVFLDEKILYINTNCIKNLDLNILENYLNNCITNSAKREYKKRFFNPLQDLELIKKRLDKIEYFDSNNTEIFIEKLKKIKDIQVIYRKILLNKNNLEIDILPQQIKYIYDTLINIHDINNLLKESLFYKDKLNNLIEKYILIYEKYFDKNNNIIKNVNTLDYYNNSSNLENLILNKDFKYEKNNGKYYIVASNKKSTKEFLNNKSNNLIKIDKDIYKLSDFDITNIGKSSYKLYNNNISNFIEGLIILNNKFLFEYYSNFINESYSLKEDLNIILDFINDFDISITNYLNSIKYKYNRPSFGKNLFSIKDLRNPIIEINNKNIQYTPNDILMNEINGLLIYGINSIGKSSLIKSIGISIIMAQTGMYIPASEYNVYIVDKILTRFPSNDNIILNKSSFMLEIEDIREILNLSTEKSVILADEICQSTETQSGISIIASTINSLSNIKCKYVIASHLQELCDITEIKENSLLKIMHMSITKDGQTIIFNRKLKDGPFQSLYGLEMCKVLNMPLSFINYAEKIRNDLIKYNDIFSIKKSRYNKDVFVKNKCTICSNNNKNTNFHIHHILPQELADKNGNIGLIHKNDKFNLVCLCQECHHKVHNNLIIIYGYIMTINGIFLNYKIN